MPYDASQDQEENTGGMDVLGGETQPSEDQQEQQAVTPETGGESGIVQTAPTAPKQGPSKTAGSGMFTNLQKYVEANKPKTKEMAGAVVKDVTGKADAIKKKASEATQSFQTSEPYTQEKARLETGQQTSQDIFGKAQSGQQLSQEEVGQFQALQKGTGAYKDLAGPDYTQQQLDAQKLQKLGQEITGSGGSEQAIKETFGKNIKDYTSGERGLDLFLLGQDPTARQDIQAGVTGATSDITGEVEAEAARASQARQALQNLAAKYQTGGEFDLGAQVGTSEAETQSATEARLAEKSGDYSQQQLAAALGADPQYGVDSASFVSGMTPSAEAVRSAEEAARLNALAQLSGKAGGYQAGDYDERLQSSIAQAQGEIARQKGLYEGEIGGLTGTDYYQNSQLLDDVVANQTRMGKDYDEISFMESHLNDPSSRKSLMQDGKHVIWDIMPAKLQQMGKEMMIKQKYGLPVTEMEADQFERYRTIANQYATGTLPHMVRMGKAGQNKIAMPGWE